MNLRHALFGAACLLPVIAGGCVVELQPSGLFTVPESGVGQPDSLAYDLQPGGARTLLDSPTPTALRLQIVPTTGDRVRAIVTTAPAGRRNAAYELILPAAQFNLLVADLRRAGFLDSGSRPTGTARIELGFGDACVAKDWTPEPRLDDLAERVLRTGRPIPLDERPVVGKATVN